MLITIEITNMQFFRAVQAARAKKDKRNYLNGVLFTTNGLCVGTDGHALVEARCTDYQHDEQAPQDFILDLGDTIPPKATRATVEIRDTGHVLFTFYEKNQELKTVIADKVSGTFPEYQRIIPKGEAVPTNGFCFNFELLTKIQKAAKFKYLKTVFYGERTALKFTPDILAEGEHFIGIAMPCG